MIGVGDRGRGRGHRAALAVWFTTLVRGQGWTIDFGNSNSNKQQATATATSNKQQQQQQSTSNSNTQQATATSNSNKQQATAGGLKLDISGTPMAQGPKLRPQDPLPKALLLTKFGPPTPGWRRSAATLLLKMAPEVEMGQKGGKTALNGPKCP